MTGSRIFARLGRLLRRDLEDRGRDRIRRAGLTGASSALAQGTTILTGLVSVPLTVGYLGAERYGVWLTLSSLLMWLAVTDLGFGGNALLTALGEANGRDDRDWACELTATAFWALVAIAAVLTAGFAIAYHLLPWPRLFNVSAAVPVTELRQAVALSYSAFILTFPVGIVVAVYHGYQQGYLANLWSVVGSVLSLAALVAVTRVEGGLPELVAALYGVRLAVSLAGAVHLFGWLRPWLLPVPRAASRRALRRLLSLGGKYLLAQLAGIGMFQSQPVIIAQVLGPAAVGAFNVAQRVLTLPLNVIQILTFPLMPAYAEAYARRDWLWIRRTLARSIWAAAAGNAVMVLVLAFFARPLIRAWVGPALDPPASLVQALSLYVLVVGVLTPASVMLYGVGRVGGQALFATLNAIATVSLGIWLTRAWGVAGMGYAMAIGMAAVNPLGQWSELRRFFREQQAGERRTVTS